MKDKIKHIKRSFYCTFCVVGYQCPLKPYYSSTNDYVYKVFTCLLPLNILKHNSYLVTTVNKKIIKVAKRESLAKQQPISQLTLGTEPPAPWGGVKQSLASSRTNGWETNSIQCGQAGRLQALRPPLPSPRGVLAGAG